MNNAVERLTRQHTFANTN